MPTRAAAHDAQVALELLSSFRRVAVPEQDETVGTVRARRGRLFQRQKVAVSMDGFGQTPLLGTARPAVSSAS